MFREVNDRIREVDEAFAAAVDGPFVVVCECADGGCIEQITLAREAYEAIRSRPNRYIVAAGHLADGVDYVVEVRDGYAVVEDGRPSGTA